jgi:hypothetical protein
MFNYCVKKVNNKLFFQKFNELRDLSIRFV